MRVPEVRFLGEQDGKPERLLKGRLAESFKQRGEVQRVYLARVISGDQVGIALCIKARHGADPNWCERSVRYLRRSLPRRRISIFCS